MKPSSLRIANLTLFTCIVITVAVLCVAVLYQVRTATPLTADLVLCLDLIGMGMLCLVGSIAFAMSLKQGLLSISISLPQGKWFPWLIILLSGFLLMLFWLGLPPVTISPEMIIVRIYWAGILFLADKVILDLWSTANILPSVKWEIALPLLCIAAALVLIVLYIGKTPLVLAFDEPAEINLSWSLARLQGFHWGMYPNMSASEVALSYSALNVISGFWMKVVGVGLIQSRLFYLVLGWASIPFLYLTARRLYNRFAAWLAVCFAVFIPLAHNYARPDLFVVLTTSITLYLYFLARESKSSTQHYLAGFIVALGIEGHPYAIRFVVIFSLLYLVDYMVMTRETRRWQWDSPFWFFALGGASFALFYIAIHILLVPSGITVANFTAIYSHEIEYSHNTNFTNPILRILADNLAFYRQYFQLHLAEAILTLVAAVTAIHRRRSADTSLLVIWIGSLVVGSLLLTHVSPYYWVFNMPFSALLIGAWISRLGYKDLVRSTRLTYMSIASIAIIALLLISDTVTTGSSPQSTEPFIGVAKQIDQFLPGNIATVIGDRVYYLGIFDHREFIQIDTFDGEEHTTKLPPLSALILTSFAGDKENELFTVKMETIATESGYSTAYCFYTYNYEIDVYLPEAQLPENAPINCKEQIQIKYMAF